MGGVLAQSTQCQARSDTSLQLTHQTRPVSHLLLLHLQASLTCCCFTRKHLSLAAPSPTNISHLLLLHQQVVRQLLHAGLQLPPLQGQVARLGSLESSRQHRQVAAELPGEGGRRWRRHWGVQI